METITQIILSFLGIIGVGGIITALLNKSIDRYLTKETEDIVYPGDYKFSYDSCLNEKGLK